MPAEITTSLNVQIPPQLRSALERQAIKDRTTLRAVVVACLESGLADKRKAAK